MFAGHIGVALAAARVEPRVNVGVFVAASLLLDLLLWLFILLGWESVTIPADFERTHQPEFVFPFSHGLLAGIMWSGLAAAILLQWRGRVRAWRRPALLVATVVFSHWLLDALVHRPELPVVGAESLRLGAGLWEAMPIALAVEAVLVLAGMALFFVGGSLTRSKALALAALCLVILAFTVVGMTMAPPPPSATAMAASSLGTIVLTCAVIGWLGRGARATPH